MKFLVFAVTLICFFACSKSNNNVNDFLDCDKTFENFKIYNGEKIECQFHYILTEYNNQKYLELNAYCADLTRPYVINMDCQDICEVLPYDENSDCGKYLKGRKTLETLLIER